MGTIIGIIVGLLIFAGICMGFASAIDSSQVSSAEKSSDSFLDKVQEMCEKNGVEFKQPKTIKVPTEIGYRMDYENEVKVELPDRKMDIALYMIDNNKLCFVSPNDFFSVDIDKIKMFTLDGSIRYNSIVKNSGKNVSVSGAIIGSAIAGPAGMVVGATKDRNNITTELEKIDERKIYIYYETENENVKLLTVDKEPLCTHFNFDDFIRKELPTKSDIYLSSNQIEKNNNNDIESTLTRLKKMYEEGLISEEDYKLKKNEVLSKLDI